MSSLSIASFCTGRQYNSAEIAHKYMDKSGRITLYEFYKGISPSPSLGYANMQNVDVWSSPGYVRQYPELKNLITQLDGIGIVNHFDYDVVTGYYFAQDNAGKIWACQNAGGAWSLISGNTLTGALGNGIRVFQNYLFVFRNNAIDLLEISTTFTTPVWTNGWQNMQVTYDSVVYTPSALNNFPSFVPITASLSLFFTGYATGLNRTFVYQIVVKQGKKFDPALTSTYSYNPGFIILPLNNRVTCIEQLGSYLYFGTNTANTYPWDMFSAIVNDPIVSPEPYIWSMKRINNILYLSAGQRGNIYYSNGSSIALFKRFPIYLFQNYNSSSHANGFIQCNKIDAMKGRLVMAMSGASGNSINGVYLMDIEEKTIVMQSSVPTGTKSQIVTLIPDQSDSDGVLVSYQNNTLNGIAYPNNGFAYPDTYISKFISPLYFVGTKNNPQAFTRLEFNLTKPLTTGQGIRISYRKNLIDNFTIIGTFDFATIGSELSWNSPISIEKAQNIQVLVELKSNTSSTNTTIELQNVMISKE